MYSSTSVVAPPTRQYSNGAASFYPGDDRHAQYQPPQQQYAQQSQYSPQPQYDPQPQQQAYSRAYEPSIAAPSYRTNDVASPVREDALPQQPQQYQPYGGVQRKPAVPVVPYGQQPSWRDI
ncbi:uncharacterized protein MYCGRDRAFT_104347 [Zymoseptoria tritici IPO323]|nr:uncharacterized protein MYCGRDRAFT_104347 [Zymoseptoria tritici IPO323]EGP87740.1 hypothetical protein MYCGRDRAFT_104347 [Zymoseptoria tritici IPO323]